MQTHNFTIEHIPALLWGNQAEKVIIAVHGNMSHKEDLPIKILANLASSKGYQVLSFDLAEHGARRNENTPCKVQNSVQDLKLIMQYAKSKWQNISLFANSLGAYFSLLAYQDDILVQAKFLSPVVNMQRIIENMMACFNISQDELKQKQIIDTPIGQKLYWDYYLYVKENPIRKWQVPTNILYGSKDELCEQDIVMQFSELFDCNLEIIPEAKHYFHTPEQIEILSSWLAKEI